MHAQKKWLRTELGVVVPIGAPVPLETTSGSFAGVSLAGGAASNGVSTTSGLPWTGGVSTCPSLLNSFSSELDDVESEDESQASSSSPRVS